MKKTKQWLTVGLILIFTVAIFAQRYKIGKLNDENQLKNVELSTLKDSVHTFVTKNGELISQVNSVKIEKDNLKEALDIAGFDKQQLKDENIKLRNLNLALKAQVQTIGTVQTTVHDTFRIENRDTVYYTRVNDWTNNHLSIYNGIIENSNLKFDYNYKLGFDFLVTDQRKKSIVTIKLDDPKAKVTTANSITIDKKVPFYKKGWVWGAVGFVGGVLISK